MTHTEILIRDIQGLLRSLEIDLRELASAPMTAEDRSKIRAQIRRCITSLEDLDRQFVEPGLDTQAKRS